MLLNCARCNVGQRWLLRGVTLGEELVTQGEGLARDAKLLERGALRRHALIDRKTRGRDHCLDRRANGGACLAGFEGRGGRIRDGVSLGCRNGPVADARLGAVQAAGVRNSRGAQVAFDFAIDQAHLDGLLACHPLAAAYHLNRAGDTDDPRQALGTAGAGDDAERNLGQSDDRAGTCDARVATERKLEAAAQRNAMQCCDDRLSAGFDRCDHRRQRRVREWLAEFPNVGAADEGLSGADDHDGRDASVLARRLNGIDKAAPHVRRGCIDWRVVDDDDGHVAVALQVHSV